jgi:predicted unusual protein kinase regulating ubiquinone biosynthesis (AarF/ABC1/UbiB family)
MSFSTKHSNSSPLSRGSTLGRLGIQLAADYLGFQVQRPFLRSEKRELKQQQYQRRSTRRLCQTIQHMKGPLMKLGQILSMQDNVLPREVIEELSVLQMQAPAMHPTLARARFKASLGKYPEEIFKQFEPEPFAAASLGQAHRATTFAGDPVVVKIQYPAMAVTIQTDFKLLRATLKTSCFSSYLPTEVIGEIESGILKETDYLREAANVEFFRQQLAPLSFVRIPRVYREFSTDKVITLSSVSGMSLAALLKTKPSIAFRNQLGLCLLQLFLFQIHEVHAFHADPHPGNYLFSADGSIGLIDFGCVKHITRDFTRLIQAFLARTWRQDPAEMKHMLRLIWGTDPRQASPEALRMLRTEIELFDWVFPPAEAGLNRVSFDNPKIFELGLRLRKECLGAKLAHKEFPFYSRAELGLYSYLRQLKATLDTNHILHSIRAAQPNM